MRYILYFTGCLIMALLFFEIGLKMGARGAGELSTVLIWSVPAWLLLAVASLAAGVVRVLKKLRGGSFGRQK